MGGVDDDEPLLRDDAPGVASLELDGGVGVFGESLHGSSVPRRGGAPDR